MFMSALHVHVMQLGYMYVHTCTCTSSLYVQCIFCLLFIIISVSYLNLLAYGRSIVSLEEQPLEQNPLHPGKNTVTYEARLLKSLFLKLID